MRGKKNWWKDTWQYQRIMEILDDYWLSEKDEAMVIVHMAFIREDGSTQVKQIEWRNRNTKLKLPCLDGQFKKVPVEKYRDSESGFVPMLLSEDPDEWETWDSLEKIERRDAE